MLKYRLMERKISRRDFLRLAGGAAATIVAYKLGRQFISTEENSSESSPAIDIEPFKGSDVALLFTSGGWGRTSLAEDPDWQEILEKVKGELENRGYTPTIAEERREDSLLSFLAVKRTVEKIDFLTTSLPGLKVIFIGRSSAALFIENLLRALRETDRVLAIEASRPLGERSALVAPDRTLVIPNPEGDPLEKGDVGEILRQSSVRVFMGKGGDLGLGPLRFDFVLPAHQCCPWNSQTEELVKNFLNLHFPNKN